MSAWIKANHAIHHMSHFWLIDCSSWLADCHKGDRQARKTSHPRMARMV
jgi:hypothetical protein